LGRACALLMPILWEEPFGIVMAEALACGTPIIGLARGSIPEIVEHRVTGFVCDDVEGLVKAVDRLDEIDRFACRRRAEAAFSDCAVVDGYLAVYRGMMTRRLKREGHII
jgi:glycosyltransferase involved in cell wall biosynthesis